MDGTEHYRHTGNVIRFGIWDARAVVPAFLLIFIKSWVLLGIACFTFVFFAILEKKGLTFDNFVRKLRTWVSGKRKPVSSAVSRYLR